MSSLRERNKRLLAINFGGIGDEVLFFPTLQSIRAADPSWRITLLLEPRSKSSVEVTDLVDDVITFDIKKRPLFVGDLAELAGLLQDGGYEAVVSSGSSPLVSILLFLSGAKIRVGYDSGPLSRKLLSCAIPLKRNQYAAMMYHDLALGLAPEAQFALPSVSLNKESLERMQAFVDEFATVFGGRRQRVVLLHPGTSRLAIEKGIFKTWAAENWAGLIGRLSKDESVCAVLAGGPDDHETLAEIAAKAPEGSRLTNAYGKTKSLADLASLISLSDLLVCVDSAPMHIGVGLAKPIVALFGPTDPAKLLPQDRRFIALSPPVGAPDETGNPRSGVAIPLDAVYRSVRDQLRSMSSQETLQESAR